MVRALSDAFKIRSYRGTRPAPLADTRVLPMYKYFSWKWVPPGSRIYSPWLAALDDDKRWMRWTSTTASHCSSITRRPVIHLRPGCWPLSLQRSVSSPLITSGCWTMSVFASSSEMKSMPHSRAVPAMCCVELALKWMLCTRLVSKGPLIHCFVRS